LATVEVSALRTLLSWLIRLPLAVVIVLFALSNRQNVMVGLWPLEDGVALPLFLLVLLPLVAGFAAGLLLGGVRSLRHRRAAKQQARRAAELEREVEVLRSRPPAPADIPSPTP
jgi:uncharacterized integral membrane protein